MAIYRIKPIKDNKDEVKTCCICGAEFKGWGNNPWPVKEDGECCDKCNYEKVIPARIRGLNKPKFTKDTSSTIDALIKSEEKAIEEYTKAIEESTDETEIEVFKHILAEEKEHLEELNKLK